MEKSVKVSAKYIQKPVGQKTIEKEANFGQNTMEKSEKVSAKYI